MIFSRCCILLLLTILISGSPWGGSAQEAVHESGLVEGQPGMITYPPDLPGESTPLERPYGIAPPLIPHDISELEVSRQTNDCVECHLEGLELSEGHVATKIPASHYRNDYTEEQRKEVIVGIRYACLQCHVPQATAEPGYAR